MRDSRFHSISADHTFRDPREVFYEYPERYVRFGRINVIGACELVVLVQRRVRLYDIQPTALGGKYFPLLHVGMDKGCLGGLHHA